MNILIFIQGDEKMYQKIENQTFGEERALYGQNHLLLNQCRFEGIEDGESALKEANHIKIMHCFFDLRYPLWHNHSIYMEQSLMSTNCRAPLWYSENIKIYHTEIQGIKTLRESKDIFIANSTIHSPEFGWRCHCIQVLNTFLESEYAFFESQNIEIENMQFVGKYSFQYVHHMTIKNSHLSTKDAFWHTNHVTVIDSTLEGEYLGWYSKNLTLIHCHIKGTQPLCYCKNLTLIDCTMEDTDLSFENSSVHASICSDIVSIKNPKKGKITVKSYQQLILENPKNKTKIIVQKKGD